jgi:hypothetical protein
MFHRSEISCTRRYPSPGGDLLESASLTVDDLRTVSKNVSNLRLFIFLYISISSTYDNFLVDRGGLQAQLPCASQQRSLNHPQIGQRKQRQYLGGVLEQTLEAHLLVAELPRVHPTSPRFLVLFPEEAL